MMARYTLMLFVCLLNSAALAEDKIFPVGIGTRTCATLESDYNQDAVMEVHYFVWAQGYMSAESKDWPREEGQIRPIDFSIWSSDTQMEFLHKFCNENPSSPYLYGVEELMFRLAAETFMQFKRDQALQQANQ